MENESGKKIQEVMTGNVWQLSTGEVCCSCKSEGVKPNTTVLYHLALNGMDKGTIGALTNAICAMLHESGLLKSLWAEAHNTATYIQNRTLTSALKGCTPY